MGMLTGEWMTSPELWKAAGFTTRNQWDWFVSKHPEVEALRQRVGPVWLWPADQVSRIRQLREVVKKDRERETNV